MREEEGRDEERICKGGWCVDVEGGSLMGDARDKGTVSPPFFRLV